MKLKTKIVLSTALLVTLSTLSFAICVQDIDMGSHKMTNLLDVNITNAHNTGDLHAATTVQSIKDYIDYLIASGIISGGGTDDGTGYTNRTCDGVAVDYQKLTYNRKVWLDRNLGSPAVATAFDDSNAYGDLYQWGRRADGHQCRDSKSSTTLASNSSNAGTRFIISSDTPNDWIITQDDTLWKPNATGLNEVCPTGYHVPTQTEWNDTSITDSGDAFTKLKLTVAGNRSYSNAIIYDAGTNGHYWSSILSGEVAHQQRLSASSASFDTYARAVGVSVRCVEN